MKIYNKSHIIAYSLSAKRANRNNIFIGTEHLNKTSMKGIEREIYQYIKKDKRVFLYKVTPKYKMENDIVPIGILIEAETIDKKEKIQICKFCYNIQKGIKINYFDGSNVKFECVGKSRLIVDIDEEGLSKNDEGNTYKEYSINVKTKMFHLLNKNCYSIKNTEPRYIQETKAKRQDIIDKKYKLCKKCVTNN